MMSLLMCFPSLHQNEVATLTQIISLSAIFPYVHFRITIDQEHWHSSIRSSLTFECRHTSIHIALPIMVFPILKRWTNKQTNKKELISQQKPPWQILTSKKLFSAPKTLLAHFESFTMVVNWQTTFSSLGILHYGSKLVEH